VFCLFFLFGLDLRRFLFHRLGFGRNVFDSASR
jgi:hypothetical protein